MKTSLCGLLLTVAGLVGCDGPATFSQRLTGEWVGRPESAYERVVREWPTRDLDPDNPEIAAAAAAAPPADLEAFSDVRVEIKFEESGTVTMSLNGEASLTGEWAVTPLEGRRAMLELAVQRESTGQQPNATTESRRFDLQWLPEGGAFVLREQASDRRFGRLIFLRPGVEFPPQAVPPASEETL